MTKKRKSQNNDDNSLYVYGWCVMASEQNIKNNKIIIYSDRIKPKRGNNGWEADSHIYYGETNIKELIENRTPKSDPILVKMKVEIV